MNRSNVHKTLILWAMMLFMMFTLSRFLMGPREKVEKIDFKEFISKVKDKEIDSVTFSGIEIVGTLKPKADAPADAKAIKFQTIGDTSSDYFLQILGDNGITPNYAPADSGTFSFGGLMNVVSLFFMLAILYMIFRAMKGGQGAMGKFGTLNLVNQQNTTSVKFADVAGMDEAKEELTEIVDFLKNPTKYTKLGAKIPKGALLIGPPGTGKTLIAKATANEAGVPFLALSGSDFMEMFVGVGASRVRDLFAQARRQAPSIIFIDEIDAIAKHRGSGAMGGGHSEGDQTLNQLLVEMDGLDEKNSQVIILAATNRPDSLDPAALRPGRFDRRVTVPLPDMKGREQILNVHKKNKPLASNVDLHKVAKNTVGMSGADLSNLLNEAALLAARKQQDEITMEIIDEAKDKVVMGTERRTLAFSALEKKKTSYHEVGHALISKLLKLHQVHKVTIVPRGPALGVTHMTPEDDQVSFSKTQAQNYICVLMGGRAAEDLMFGEFTTGASDDIKKATNIARKMVTEWGMSEKFGPMNLMQQTSAIEGGELLSSETKKAIDEEVAYILKTSYDRTKQLLSDNQGALDAIATFLLEKETITGDEMDLVLSTVSK